MPVQIKFDPHVTQAQSQILQDATPRNDGVMTELQAQQLAALVAGGGSGGVLSFERAIVQPADGSSFVVVMPTPRANANYKVVATLADAALDVVITIPKASRTTTQFLCVTSDELNSGDSIDFLVGA